MGEGVRGVARIAHVTTVDISVHYLLLAQLLALRDAGFEVTAVSAPGPWVAGLEEIRHLPLGTPARVPGTPAQMPGRRVRLIRLFRRERFDLVHTHNPKPGVLGRVAARVASVPRVMNTVHGLYATPEDRLRRRAPVLAAEWIAARFSDLELYQSAEDLAWARRYIWFVEVARSTWGTASISAFTPSWARRTGAKLRAGLGIGEDELVVGTVGRMVRRRATASCSRREDRALPDPERAVPGRRGVRPGQGGRHHGEAIERARDDFVFTGWREDVADLMALMDVFVLPSWREGLPRSAIEAAAIGLPQVLTDIRGCREVVRDGVEGFLVPVRDPAAWPRRSRDCWRTRCYAGGWSPPRGAGGRPVRRRPGRARRGGRDPIPPPHRPVPVQLERGMMTIEPAL